MKAILVVRNFNFRGIIEGMHRVKRKEIEEIFATDFVANHLINDYSINYKQNENIVTVGIEHNQSAVGLEPYHKMIFCFEKVEQADEFTAMMDHQFELCEKAGIKLV